MTSNTNPDRIIFVSGTIPLPMLVTPKASAMPLPTTVASSVSSSSVPSAMPQPNRRIVSPINLHRVAPGEGEAALFPS